MCNACMSQFCLELEIRLALVQHTKYYRTLSFYPGYCYNPEYSLELKGIAEKKPSIGLVLLQAYLFICECWKTQTSTWKWPCAMFPQKLVSLFAGNINKCWVCSLKVKTWLVGMDCTSCKRSCSKSSLVRTLFILTFTVHSNWRPSHSIVQCISVGQNSRGFEAFISTTSNSNWEPLVFDAPRISRPRMIAICCKAKPDLLEMQNNKTTAFLH